MADVFLSYSRLDREHAKLVATTLEAEQISVWWDSELHPGETFDAEIENQITEAKCVLVIWTTNSVKSKWVRSEASEGDDRQILIPVKKEPVRLPLAFRLIQTEDLTNWHGEREAQSWQRVILQVRALAGMPIDAADPFPKRETEEPPPFRPMVLRSSVAPLGAIAVLIAVLAIWGLKGGAGLAVALGLAALAFLLFRLAEHDLSPHMKALARRWLLPQEGQFRVNTAEAFNYIFEAVFGRTHFSAECFVRSTLISTAFLAIIILISILIFGDTVHHTPSSIINGFLFGFIVNPIGDYVALLKTRLLLRRYKAGVGIVPIICIDVVGICLIFISVISIAIAILYGLSYLTGGLSQLTKGASYVAGGEQCLNFTGYLGAITQTINLVLQQPLIDFFSSGSTACRFPQGDRVLLYSAFLTMFMTSLWLWIALLFSPIIRFLVWSRMTGLTFIGFVFDVHNAPFAAMGYLSAFLILVVGALMWGATEVIAAVTAGKFT
jgi:TIR domain